MADIPDQQAQRVHQIEYRWHQTRDLSPMASSMSAESTMTWDSRIRAWIRHPNVEEPAESVRYQILSQSTAALAWRHWTYEATEWQGGRGRPLVSRVLVGDPRVLSPAVAIALCRSGQPASAGPRVGEVMSGERLPTIDGAELAALTPDTVASLDEESAMEKGLPQIVAAALADPATPLAIGLGEPQVFLPPAQGIQPLLLWGLWRIAWPLLGSVRRGWSFSTFESPLGYVDPRTLPDIVFRAAQLAQAAAPAVPRKELRIRLGTPPASGTFHDELAEWLVAEYREAGGDNLAQLIAAWTAGQPVQARLAVAHEKLLVKWCPPHPDSRGGDVRDIEGGSMDEAVGTAGQDQLDEEGDVDGESLRYDDEGHVDDGGTPGGKQDEPAAGFSLSDLLDRLAVVQDAGQFNALLRDIIAPPARPDGADRERSRALMGDNNCYVPAFRRHKYELHVYELARIFCLIVIPDLDMTTVRDEVASWAYRGERSVAAGLLTAAKDSGDHAWQEMRRILQPVLADLWIADRGLWAEWAPGSASAPDTEPWRAWFGRGQRG